MTIRMTLVLLLIVPAAMAYPWHSVPQRWILGVAVAAVVILFVQWRGVFLTTLVGRRWAMLRRRRGVTNHGDPERVSIALRVEAGQVAELAVSDLVSYLHRYGVRCESVRVVSRDEGGRRDTWVSLILDAKHNLPALQGRSSDAGIDELALVVGRRLAEQLRETGLQVSVDRGPDAPLSAGACEGWRGVDDGDGQLSICSIPADGDLVDRVAELQTGAETWTVLEFSSAGSHPVAAAAVAIRTGEQPGTVSGLRAQPGRQRPLLEAMDPRSVRQLGLPTQPVPDLAWPVSAEASTVSRT